MKNKLALAGVAFGVLGTIMHTLMSITSKVAYNVIDRDMFLVLMYLTGTMLVILYIAATRQTGLLRLSKEQWLPTILVGIFYFVGANAYFLSIQVTSPSLVSFFGRMQTIYVVIFGVLFLRERMNRGEVVGMVVTMAGALVVTYASGQNVLIGFLLALLGESLFNALGLISSKVAVKRTVPNLALVFYRSLVVFVLMFLSALVRGKLSMPSGAGIGWSALAALCGPVLTFVFINRALSLIEASKMAVIRNIQPIITVLLSIAILRTAPTARQLVGGAVSLVGVWIIVMAQTRTAAADAPEPQSATSAE